MPLELGPRSSLIKKWKDLKKSSARTEHRLFLAEGTNAAREAHLSQWPLEAVCYTQRWLHKHPELAETFSHLSVIVTEPALRLLTEAGSPDGIVLVCRNLAPDSLAFWHDSDPTHAAGRRSPLRCGGKVPIGGSFLGVLATELQDPGNLGTLIRTTVAVGGQPVVLGPGSVDPLNPKVLRASAGLWFRSPAWRLSTTEGLKDWLTQLRKHGVKIYATAAAPAEKFPPAQKPERAPHQSMWTSNFCGPTCFLLGNEARGLDPELLALSDASVFIPMEQEAESLNVGVAGALLLYEARRQRQLKFLAT